MSYKSLLSHKFIKNKDGLSFIVNSVISLSVNNHSVKYHEDIYKIYYIICKDSVCVNLDLCFNALEKELKSIVL